MNRIMFLLRKGYIRVLVVFFMSFFSLMAYTQPPPTDPQAPSVDPKTLNSSQLKDALVDNNAGKDNNVSISKNTTLAKDSLNKDNIKAKELTALSTYGENVFPGPVTDIGELSTPPLDYPIGVGDNIIVALWGGAEFQNSYVVARDGSIFPKNLGKIIVQGLTFDNARSLIASRFRSVTPPGTNIAVTMGQPRTISVNVVGNVKNPGPVVVSAFSNAFNVIGIAGGVNGFADLRSIQIKRYGQVIDELDVYKYLTTGDFGKHVYLQNNDYIVVGNVQKKVLASGQWKRPMYYQLKMGEGIRALLSYSGGLNPDALASGMKVIRSEDETQVQHDINANAILKIAGQDYLLEDGDIVVVPLIKEGIANKVELKGEVKYPGIYEYRKGDRLFDLINRAGGVTRNTYLGRAYIFRGAGDSTNLKSDRLEVSLNDINGTVDINNSRENITIMPNDVVHLFNANAFADAQYVEIFGEVRKEGKMRKYGGMTLEDLIFLANGIKPSAEYGMLQIASVVDMDSAMMNLKPTRTIVKEYSINANLMLDTMASKILLKPYDQVYVRKNPDFQLQQNVELKGMLKYPGFYPRLKKTEKLSSFIHRAGGVAENANISGALLFRVKPEILRQKQMYKPEINNETGQVEVITDSMWVAKFHENLDEPVSIDLYRAMKYPNSKDDIVLQEGDVILIPEKDPFVRIKGQVQSPLRISYDKQNSSLPYYIDKAGGFGERPWRKRIYVTYANGRSKRTKSLFFIRFYPKVEEGSTVIVPLKPKGEAVVDAVKTTVLSSIPIILSGFIFKFIK